MVGLYLFVTETCFVLFWQKQINTKQKQKQRQQKTTTKKKHFRLSVDNYSTSNFHNETKPNFFKDACKRCNISKYFSIQKMHFFFQQMLTILFLLA